MPEEGKNNSACGSEKTINYEFEDYMHVAVIASKKRRELAYIVRKGEFTMAKDISLPSFQ